MQLSSAERLLLKDLVFAHHRDWAALHAALEKRHKLTISQSSLDRFFSGRTHSRRTLCTLAVLLGTTPDALISQARLTNRATRPTAHDVFASAKPLKDPDAFRVAFQLWVEMNTRKLGLPIDPGQDIITECYDSWYAFFKAARELIKAIPLYKDPRSSEMRLLVQLSQAILNEGLRPHLQRWQGRLRRWSENAAANPTTASFSPQEAQQQFPEWAALCDDLIATNKRLIGYVGSLEVMVASSDGSPRSNVPQRSRR